MKAFVTSWLPHIEQSKQMLIALEERYIFHFFYFFLYFLVPQLTFSFCDFKFVSPIYPLVRVRLEIDNSQMAPLV